MQTRSIIPGVEYRQDVAACRAVLRRNSRTFHSASLLLPQRIRDPACVLYGFCRLADDAVDVDGGQIDAVQRLRERVQRAAAGQPLPDPADRALAVVIERHRIPAEILFALIDGLAWDAEGRRYQTFDDLLHYAARVAGTVGAMMALLMDARSQAALARACDLGVAMQLSNIARDVGEDACMGRIYLPLQWLREHGIDESEWLAAPRFTPALGAVVQRLLHEADTLYARAAAGVAMLPLDCRPGINAARYLYAAIGHEVARAGCDSVSRRAVVRGAARARLLARAVANLAPGDELAEAPALAATLGLVRAGASTEGTGAALPPAWWQWQQRAEATLDLFTRLEQRDQQRRATTTTLGTVMESGSAA
jgi:15-cis-phytoene synthase